MTSYLIKTAARLLLTGFVCLAGSANAALILDVGAGGNAAPCGACGTGLGSTFGWLFEVTDTISVDGIGVWDAYADGIGPSVEAGLWEDGGALLASAVVSDSSSPVASSGAGQWLFEDFASLILTPGRYILGSVFFDTTPQVQFGTTVTTIPQISYLSGRSSFFPDVGFQRPDLPFFIDGIFGTTLRTTEVPLPSTLALFVFSLVVFVYLPRRLPPISWMSGHT